MIEHLVYIEFWILLIGFSLLETAINWRSGLAGKFIRWPTNIGLMLIDATIAATLPGILVLSSLFIYDPTGGLLHWFSAPVWAQVLLWACVGTLLNYWMHRAFHSFPILWRFHKVHHSDTLLDATTGFRHHPGEQVASVLVYAVPTLILQPTPEVILIVSLLEIFSSIFTHINLPLPQWLDHILGMVIITPRMHNLHHSDYQPETDSNFGATFVWWDCLFGTYLDQPLQTAEKFRFGLDDVPKAEAEDLVQVLISPFLSNSVREKIKL